MDFVAWGLAIVLLVLAVLAVKKWPSPGVAARGEAYTSIVGVKRRYAQKRVPNPALTDGRGGPLAPYLSAVLDPTLPPSAPGEGVPWSNDEMREVADHVVGRINAQNPALRLQVVALDNVKKTVDAYKTLHYEADVQVHSVTRMFSSRLTIKVDLSSGGRLYVRGVSAHNAERDTSGILPILGGASGETYATFQPAITSVQVPRVMPAGP